LTSVEKQFVNDNDVFPAVIANDGSVNTIEEAAQWIQDHQEELEAILKKNGAILFRGFPVSDAEMFDSFSANFGYPDFTYKESLSNAVRINFTDRVFTANEAPKHAEINLHNEMAQTPVYPDKIFFFCQTPADQGGASPIMRCDMLFDAIKAKDAQLAKDFAEKGVKYTTTMPAANDAASAQGRSWKDTLSVDTIEAAEAKLSSLGYTWNWNEDGSIIVTTPVLPAVRTLDCGRQSFFNQIIAAYLGWAGVRENHTDTLRFGDDTNISKEGLELVCELAEELTFDTEWQAGDVALVDNNIAMHGRRPYSGDTKRIVLVALGAAKENDVA
ncbi:TauD/TfdA family dioxygenase, partial [Vibrio sp.]|nr:TauD/TfdA family dioxygenase [Vibrio sp.]